jgi:tartrate-resistant acid phosphatase type 5
VIRPGRRYFRMTPFKRISSDRLTAGHFISLSLILLLLAACVDITTPPVNATQPHQSPAPPGITITPETQTSTPQPTFTPTQTPPPSSTPTPTFTPTATTPPPIHFAVIGDFGGNGQPEKDVANLVKSWNPDFIITVGDNNYPDGSADTIDLTIGQYYHEFISPYTGRFGQGADSNRFFPVLGNHDWNTDQAHPYLDYFTLPNNERYYDFTWGPIHFFAIDSDSREPDGVSKSSTQADWLKERLSTSDSPWNVVYFHHAPYSSGLHGSTEWMRWPFQKWGADVVLSGHDHTYERLLEDNIPYFVNGLGGGAVYNFNEVVSGSQFRYNSDYGAMLVTASDTQMDFQFYDRKGDIIDGYEMSAAP